MPSARSSDLWLCFSLDLDLDLISWGKKEQRTCVRTQESPRASERFALAVVGTWVPTAFYAGAGRCYAGARCCYVGVVYTSTCARGCLDLLWGPGIDQ